MNILVIGSKGFIGSHLFNFLLQKGHRVIGCDIIPDKTQSSYININETDFNSIFSNNKFDVCINCSGAASVPNSIQNPLNDFELNTIQVFKLLDAIRIHQADCKFINLSSAAVYGNPAKLPIHESQICNPLSPYGIHKMNAEQIMSEFNTFYNIPTCSLRIFSAYGEGLKKQLFWDLYNKANSGEEFSLFGTGNESRDFIYIADLIHIIDLVIRKSHFNADIINVANGEEIYIKDAVSIFFNFFHEKIEYNFSGEERKGDPNNWVADISKLKEMGYRATFNIEEGLEHYYKWIKSLN